MHSLGSIPVTIADGQTESAAFEVPAGCVLCALRTPAEFDGTEVTLRSADALAGTYLPVHDDDGAEYTVTTAASRETKLNIDLTASVRYGKLVAGTAQTGDTALVLVFRSV